MKKIDFPDFFVLYQKTATHINTPEGHSLQWMNLINTDLETVNSAFNPPPKKKTQVEINEWN